MGNSPAYRQAGSADLEILYHHFIHLRRRPPRSAGWMNAQKVDKSFMCSKLDASVDFATGG
jgi:hypothetical protein